MKRPETHPFHSVVEPPLGKWLYLPESGDDFEDATHALVECIVTNDPRIGVEPKSNPAKGGRKLWRKNST